MERDLIVLAIKNDLFHLLNKEACEMTLAELLSSGVITIYEGKFYLSDTEGDEMTLDDFVDEFRALFTFKRLGVKGKTASASIVKPKARRFKLSTGLTYEQMLNLARKHIEDTPPMYITSAKYFFYKQDQWKNVHSKAEEILDEIKQEQKDEIDFNINMDD